MIMIKTKECAIHITPLPETIINGDNGVTIEFDDNSGKRWRASLLINQAYRITTIDCIDVEPFCIDNGLYARFILEDMDSEWIKELTKTLKEKDKDSTFMEKAHHYIFPFQDEVIEVIAWDMHLTKIG